jgi:hypothetical protein
MGLREKLGEFFREGRQKNPNSPEWEWTLVEQVKRRTQLLGAG